MNVLIDDEGNIFLTWVEGGVFGPLKLSRTVTEHRLSMGWTYLEPNRDNSKLKALGVL